MTPQLLQLPPVGSLDWLWQISSFNELKNLDSMESNKAKIFFVRINILQK
ncbi:hypothetical protein H0901_05170 [Microcystis aeruginosa BLCCF158]|uniref:Uncharacterized protein n=1 Tax=Microcystis aeruginosa BLCC-F158 TaxID=2755316 RepID=A0A841UUJ8_MICAE|nr:hypothetical protein [Microcystis aeruginosa]MBC1194691.1 hypothetical protein [Microcystis aeruginosa BLCC-F158]